MSGIWRLSAMYDAGAEDATRRRALEAGWTLGEGDTALERVADPAGLLGLLGGERSMAPRALFLKREDQNPGGSHKDRGLLFQVARHGEEPGRTFVISSSGNAAISGAAACAAAGHRLLAFVSTRTDAGKLARLRQSGGLVLEASKPLNFAKYAARVFGLLNLRGTADPVASVGYRSLGGELLAQVEAAGGPLDAALTFSSSGISAEGVLDGWQRVDSGAAPALWSVQSGECLGIVRALHPDVAADPDSPAGRLGVRNPPGAGALAQRLVGSGGGAVAVDGAEVRAAAARLEGAGVRTSAEGAAVLAAVARLCREGALAGLRVAAVMTGRRHGDDGDDGDDGDGDGDGDDDDDSGPQVLTSYLEVRAALVELGLEPASTASTASSAKPGGVRTP